jgi:hypothetical protein
MKTEELIEVLSAGVSNRRPAPEPALYAAAALSVVVAGVALTLTMGLRPDFSAAVGDIRFLFKFVFTIAVGLSAFALVRRALNPVSSEKLPLGVLLVGPAILAVGVGVELLALPAAGWSMAAAGKNGLLCLTVIPALGIVPLGLIIGALRRGAPTRPGLAGFCAGVLAGGIAATFYAANCTDDSPLFVATWYPIAIGALAVTGTLLGRRFARW